MGVRQRGKTLFIDFRFYLPDGRRVRCRETEGKDNTKNKARAEKKWKAIQYHMAQGTFNYLEFFPHGSKAKYFNVQGKSDMTYAEFRGTWLEQLTVRGSTDGSYTSVYKNHIEPYFGHWKLAEITEHAIKVFRKKLLSELKESTVNQVVKLLCSPLKDAVKQEILDKYPCEYISKIEEGVVDIEPFSFDELRHLLDVLWKKDQEWHDLFLFWSRTGLRPGELYALKWEHVDLFNNQVSIRASLGRNGEDGPVKTKHSNRTINLRPAVIEALKRQKARTGLMDGYIFLNLQQKQWNQTNFAKAFRYRLRLADIKIRPQKQMRHTFATLHIGAGESISWVSKTLGHSDVQITLKRYNRFIPNLTREDGSAFENVLNGQNLGTGQRKTL